MYYNMTNKELLDAYNASAEYDDSMCGEICTRVGMHGVPATIPDYVKDMYVRDFKLGQMKNEHLTALEITKEGA